MGHAADGSATLIEAVVWFARDLVVWPCDGLVSAIAVDAKGHQKIVAKNNVCGSCCTWSDAKHSNLRSMCFERLNSGSSMPCGSNARMQLVVPCSVHVALGLMIFGTAPLGVTRSCMKEQCDPGSIKTLRGSLVPWP